MKKEQKGEVIRDLRELFAGSSVVVVSDYRGMSVEQITNLRTKYRTVGASLRVVKNTLAKRAFAETTLPPAADLFEGPTAVTFGNGDAVATLKVVAQQAKEIVFFKMRGGVIAGARLNAAELVRLSTLPPREVLLAKMLATMNGPASGLVGVLSGVPRKLVGVLEAIRQKKAA